MACSAAGFHSHRRSLMQRQELQEARAEQEARELAQEAAHTVGNQQAAAATTSGTAAEREALPSDLAEAPRSVCDAGNSPGETELVLQGSVARSRRTYGRRTARSVRFSDAVEETTFAADPPRARAASGRARAPKRSGKRRPAAAARAQSDADWFDDETFRC